MIRITPQQRLYRSAVKRVATRLRMEGIEVSHPAGLLVVDPFDLERYLAQFTQEQRQGDAEPGGAPSSLDGLNECHCDNCLGAYA